jgi:hypothetical protein
MSELVSEGFDGISAAVEHIDKRQKHEEDVQDQGTNRYVVWTREASES